MSVNEGRRNRDEFMAVEMSVSRTRINHLCPLRCRAVALEAAATCLSSDCTGRQTFIFRSSALGRRPASLRPRFGRGAFLPVVSSGIMPSPRPSSWRVSLRARPRFLRGPVGYSIYPFRGLVRGGKWVVLMALTIPWPYTGEDSHGSGRNFDLNRDIVTRCLTLLNSVRRRGKISRPRRGRGSLGG